MKLVRRMVVAGGVACLSMMCAGKAFGLDPCSMLTPEQAAAVLGVPEVNAGASASRCIWTPKKYQKGAGMLTVQFEGAHDGAKMMGMGTAVSGVGDEAIQTVVASTNSALLHVRKGNTWFVVDVHGVPLDQATQMEKSVAQAIVGKL